MIQINVDYDKNWKMRYWDLMMSEDYESGFILKENNFPNSFFKYRKLNERTIESILENYIWLADISSLNDPFECSLQFDHDKCSRLYFASSQFHTSFKNKFGIELTAFEIETILKSKDPNSIYAKICKTKNIIMHKTPEEQYRLLLNGFRKEIEETNKDIRISSFSEINDSLLLWSHYSDDHKGICIEYGLTIERSEIRAFLQPIVYSEEVYKIELFEELSILKKVGSTLIKSKDWEYEKEWRITTFRQGDKFPKKLTISNPKAVYLGVCFHLNEEDLKQQLFEVLKNKNIPCHLMTRHPNEYKLIKQKYKEGYLL